MNKLKYMTSAVCFGEVLWDVFPTHKKIGGAPLNVALRLNSLQINTQIISRVGNDKYGQEIIDFIKYNQLNTDLIQKDPNYNTGMVSVSLDQKGSATYIIEAPAAWDKIELKENDLHIVGLSDIFIFGSLACRDAHTKQTLIALLKHAKYKVFDVNLRPPFYSIALLLELMKLADFIKCNDEEINEICEGLDFISSSLEAQIDFLSRKTGTDQICVTRGENGAMLFVQNKIYKNAGYKVAVQDTVGAGDSFLATLIANLALQIDPDLALARGSAMGALVASKIGANPRIEQHELKKLIEGKI